ILGVLGAAGHGEAFGLGQNDVILEHRVDVGGNIVVGAPSGRTILHVVAVFLGVFAFQVHRQPQRRAAANPHGQVQRVQAGPPAAQSYRQCGEKRKHLGRNVCAGGKPPGFPQVGGKQAQQDIGQVQQDQLFHIQLLHRSGSFLWARSTTALFTSSLNCASFSSTDGRSLRSAFLTFFWVYSEKAAVSASASRPLKKIRYLGGEVLRSFFTA